MQLYVRGVASDGLFQRTEAVVLTSLDRARNSPLLRFTGLLWTASRGVGNYLERRFDLAVSGQRSHFILPVAMGETGYNFQTSWSAMVAVTKF